MAEVGKFVVKLTSKFDDKGLKRMAAGLKNVAKVGLIAITAITGAFVKMVQSTTKSALEIDKLRKITGATSEELTRLGYAAEQEHASLADLSTGVRRLSRAMSDANRGLVTYQRAFDDVGVQVVDTNGKLRDQIDVMMDVADVFHGMEDKTKKAAVAQELFGRAGANLVPFLNMGREGIAALGDEAEKLGLVMTDETVISFKEFDDTITALKGAVRGLVMTVVTEFLPRLKSIAENIKNIIVEGDNWKRGMVAVITVALEGFKLLATVLNSVGKILGDIAFLLVSVFTLNIDDIKIAVNELWQDMKSGFITTIETITGGWEKIGNAASGVNEEIREDVKDTGKVIGDSIGEGVEIATKGMTKLESFGESSFTSLFKTIGRETEEGEKKFDTFIDGVKKAFLDLVATMMGKAAIFGLLNLLTGGTFGATRTLTKFVGLQEGGMVTRPTVAMLGEKENEIVTPLSKVNKMFGGDVNININGNVDMDNVHTIATELKDAVRDGQADGLAKTIVERGTQLEDEAT